MVTPKSSNGRYLISSTIRTFGARYTNGRLLPYFVVELLSIPDNRPILHPLPRLVGSGPGPHPFWQNCAFNGESSRLRFHNPFPSSPKADSFLLDALAVQR